MIYFYHCYRGAHLSSMAAAMHLGKINSCSGVREILDMEYFDTLQSQDMGVPVLAGKDGGNNPVYFMGLGRGSKIFARLAESLVRELDLDIEYKSIDCLPCLTTAIRVGGFLSRYRQFRSLGRTLAAQGVHSNLRQIEALVLQAKGN